MSKIFLSVPAGPEVASSSTQMPAKDFEEQSRIADAVKVLVGKKEVEGDPEKLEAQILGHIKVVRSAIAKAEEEKDAPLKIKSVKVGLTVTVGGNIGLASAEAEASIEIEFTR